MSEADEQAPGAPLSLYPGAVSVFYEESKASRESLGEMLTQYRSNTTTLVALATGAATFFSLSTSAKGPLYVLALVSYGVAAFAAAVIYAPKVWIRNVAHDVEAALRSGKAITATKMKFDLAVGHQAAIAKNLKSIDGVRRWYNLLLLATVGVVGFAGANTAIEKPAAPDKPTKVILVDETE
jgi:hypothetical protein